MRRNASDLLQKACDALTTSNGVAEGAAELIGDWRGQKQKEISIDFD